MEARVPQEGKDAKEFRAKGEGGEDGGVGKRRQVGGGCVAEGDRGVRVCECVV